MTLYLLIDAVAFRRQCLDVRLNLTQLLFLVTQLLLTCGDDIGNRALLVWLSRQQFGDRAYPCQVAEFRSRPAIEHLRLQSAFPEISDDAIETKRLALGEHGHGRG